MMGALITVVGVFAIGVTIGLFVLVNAELALTTVAKAAARDVSRAFWVGVLWQLLAVPLLAALALACALTIVGILLIPLVALAWALAYAGAFTIGILAVAIVIGRAVAGRPAASGARAVALRALVVGLGGLALVWSAAALLHDVRGAGAVARLVALAITWAAATVGLGAVVQSRGGLMTFRFDVSAEGTTASWQTPTPVSGVVAARRPLPREPVATVDVDAL